MLTKALNEESICLSLQATSKKEVIAELVDILCKTGKVGGRDGAIECILQREKMMSTGLRHGIAIPHGKCESVPSLIACVALKKKGIEFDSMDGKKSKIFICTVSPSYKSGPHIEFLEELTRLLKEPGMRRHLLNAKTKQEVMTILNI